MKPPFEALSRASLVSALPNFVPAKASFAKAIEIRGDFKVCFPSAVDIISPSTTLYLASFLRGASLALRCCGLRQIELCVLSRGAPWCVLPELSGSLRVFGLLLLHGLVSDRVPPAIPHFVRSSFIEPTTTTTTNTLHFITKQTIFAIKKRTKISFSRLGQPDLRCVHSLDCSPGPAWCQRCLLRVLHAAKLVHEPRDGFDLLASG